MSSLSQEKEQNEISEPITKPSVPRRRLPFYALQAADGVSMLGNQMTQLVLPWFVLQTTGSAAETGITAFFGTVPLVLAGFFGGTIIDRLGFKRTSVISDIFSGVCVALIPLLHLTVGLAFWQLLVLVFLGALFDTPGVTAREALLPEVADLAGMRLEQANAIDDTIQSMALIFGPILAGLLITLLGPVNVLWLNAATFFISVLLVGLALPKNSPKVAKQSTEKGQGSSYSIELIEGLRFIFQDRLIRTVVLLSSFLYLIFTPLFAIIMPVYMQKTYGDAINLGLFIAALGGGTLLGATVYGLVGHRLPRRALFIGGLFGLSISFIILAFLPPLPVIIGAGFLGGLTSGPLNPLISTIWQKRTPAELRGRVFGTSTALALAASPLGMLIVGFLLEFIGIQPTLIILAVSFLLLSASTLWLRTLLELDNMTTREE